MSNNLEIVRAVYSGLSQRLVAATHRVSRNTVALLVRQAESQGWLTLEDLKTIDVATFSARLGQDTPTRDTTFKMPDYEYVHTELAKPHVTLKLLWEEYVERCQPNNLRYYMETQFRRYYHKYAKVSKATIRLEHKPGLSMEVDWAGRVSVEISDSLIRYKQSEGAFILRKILRVIKERIEVYAGVVLSSSLLAAGVVLADCTLVRTEFVCG